MNKVVKRKLIGTIICFILGIISIIYTIFMQDKINEDIISYFLGFSCGIIGVGIASLIIIISSLKNPEKRRELENSYYDEMLNTINVCAMSIVFRISIFIEGVISIICALTNNLKLSEYFGILICIQIIIYLIVYFLVKKKY